MRSNQTVPALTRLAQEIQAFFRRSPGWGTLLALPGAVLAGPAGEQLAAGSATVARPDALTTQINQSSARAVLNWQSFSVGEQESVRFAQPNSAAVTLNRVVGGHESEILGRLDANGRVFLVNPQGVYFGPGARVDTAGLAASVLDIRDQDFMAGRYVFTKGAGADGAIVNEGAIAADQFVVLMGERVANEGLIAARLGTVVLAAGSATTLELDNAGLVNFAVDEKATAALAGVDNTGQIIADGGRVLMTAKVADGLVATAVNNAGLVRARSIDEADGEIFLRASGGAIRHSGTLDAAGSDGHDGGRIRVLGEGDVELTAGSRIDASGDGAGHGGNVRVIADNNLAVRQGASLDVAGGAVSVRGGGMLELSGHQSMALAGDVNLGNGGHLLLDPRRLELISGSSGGCYGGSSCALGVDFIGDLLASGNDVTLVASEEIFATSPLVINGMAGGRSSSSSFFGGNGNLSILVGTVTGVPSSSGSLTGGDGFGSGTGGSCGGDGLCFPGFNGIFQRSAFGDIHLDLVDIFIDGQFTASGGSLGGDVILGNIAAQSIRINTGGSSGSSSARIGHVQARSLFAIDSSFASIQVNAKSLIIGDVLVDNGSGGFGGLQLNADSIDIGHLGVVNGSSSGFVFVNANKFRVTGDTFISGQAFILADQGADFHGKFYADALFANASDGFLLFRGHTTIGSLALPDTFGDFDVINAIADAAINSDAKVGFPIADGLVAGPNAVFRARDGIGLFGGLNVLDGDTPYLVFQTDGPLDFGPGVTASPHFDFIAQFTTFSTDIPMLVEDNPSLGFAHFYNSEHFSKLPGTTIVLGSESLLSGAHFGPIIVAARGPMDLGFQNVAFVSRGATRVSSNFTTRGLSGALRFIGGQAFFFDPTLFALEEEFELPIVDELNLDDGKDEKEEDLYVTVEGEDGTLSEQLVSTQSNTGQMCE